MGVLVGLTHVRALIFSLLVALPLCAHEIGTTRVVVTFHRDGTWLAEVTTAPGALLNKLQALARVRRSAPAGAAESVRALRQFSGPIADAVDVRFDGRRVPSDVEIVSVPPNANGDAVVLRFRGEVPRGARTFTWRFALSYSAYALTIVTPSATDTVWVPGDESSEAFPVASIHPAARMTVVREYLALGFTHIVPLGLDHILFVLGMFLLSSRVRPVLTQVTAFTVAHSITLGLAMFGVFSASPRVVEPMIALSIAYVAIENLTTTRVRPWRVAIVFAFGLLHGLGFAGVLQQLGLPASQRLPALVAFNVGVEAGQLAVIGMAWLLVVSWAGEKSWYRRRVLIPASLVIAATGLFWTIERL